MQKRPSPLPPALVIAGRAIALQVSRHRRARRMTLRYHPQSDTVKLSLPTRCPYRDALAFLDSHQLWLERAVQRHPHTIPFAPGMVLPFFGTPLVITPTGSLRGLVEATEDGRLDVPGEAAHIKRRVLDWLKKRLHAQLHAWLPPLTEALGASPKRIALKDTQSRWGSCSADGVIALSWRLALAPPEVCFYVLCHELAHLKEPNHSTAFWRSVALLCPDWKTSRTWLRQEGHTLYRYGA